MTEVPEGLIYTKEHEWIRLEGNEITVGITDYAQNALTDVVWVELPEVGVNVSSMESFASVESVKSVSEIYAPISGEVIEVNALLEDQPEIVNSSPYEDGWFYKLNPTDMNELENLLSPEDYSEVCED